MIEILKSRILINIQGKNINRFIKKVIVNKISILSLKYINEKEIEMLIYKKDYQRILKIKSIYEILEKDIFGFIKIKKVIRLNIHLLIITFICLLLLFLLTNLIFNIEVVHTNKEIRSLIKNELKNNGIKKFAFKKSFSQKEKIKEKILNKYKDDIEWLEIEEAGTKYIIRVEEREILKKEEQNSPRNIVAKKDAVIKKVISSQGEVLKEIDEFVKKGDTIISGEIILNDRVMGKVKAKGKVYGEVWYVIKTDYPFVYEEYKETGKSKEVFALKFLNHNFDLTLHKFKNKKTKDRVIIQNQLLPLKIVKQKQKEVTIKRWILTFDEALLKAEEKATEKVLKKLNKNEYIIRKKYLKSEVKSSTIEVDMFFSVYENITDYKKVE